ncbi:cytochrome P450 [Pseudomonas sp. R2.Fl]|nr:cytochrome P450 [Pseudomonas sp. R2.Fl]
MKNSIGEQTRSSASENLPVLTVSELDADAHGAFGHWRKTHPVVAHEGGGYLVLRHADVLRLAADPRLQATETALPQSRGITQGPLFDIFQHGMLTANDGTHERRRSPMSRAVAGQLIAQWRRHVRLSAEALIDGFYADGQAEFVSQFADQIPIRTLAGLFGVPPEDLPAFTRNVQELGRFFGAGSTEDDIPASTAAAGQLREYLGNLLRERRKVPDGDFLTVFQAAADDGEGLSPPEAIFQVIQLILGGTESVRAAIVAQTALLLLHREQWKAVCADSSLVPAVVTEALRFEPGIAGLVRITREAIDLEGFTLPAGQLVILSTMSAMRDERVFQRSDIFDIRRPDAPKTHPVFGWGAHRCLAEALARAELEESLIALTSRLPRLRLEDIPIFHGHVFIRNPGRFCVSWPTDDL